MHHQLPLTSALAAAGTVTGSHPGPAYYAFWVLVIGAVVGAPIYAVRKVRAYLKRR